MSTAQTLQITVFLLSRALSEPNRVSLQKQSIICIRNQATNLQSIQYVLMSQDYNLLQYIWTTGSTKCFISVKVSKIFNNTYVY